MAEKLWQKDYKLDPVVERFTIGNDYIIDMNLIKYDITASIIHAKMLLKMGYIAQDEFEKLKGTLEELLVLVEQKKFQVKEQDEDCHTAIENYLTQKLGDIGKKIHTARSRNDQVLTALRLLYKDELGQIEKLIDELRKAIGRFSKKYGQVKFAGFTHTRKAMPTDFRTWAMALNDALKDDLRILRTVRQLVDQSPLGTGAGYGVPIQIDRKFTAKQLGFGKVQENPIYTQLSRGKFEYLLLHCLSQISYDLNRFASDMILFSLKDIGYLILPKELCTGSSIMPHKLNPDVLELVRAYHSRNLSRMVECATNTLNLITGYHRDLQLLKETVIGSFQDTKDILRVMKVVFEKIQVNKKACSESLTDEVLATHRVYELVNQGVPFRDAYRRIAQQLGGDEK
ncbi:MAG TPA: argininosuccinate lyase [Pseudothermotoga sp.]|nr:argininosuccinate lyase [Pseudothermotoga sp.]HOK83959.1 argininosuccinate lyase [Pseudothermotoga sp.]HPP70655.1 argininosuccinate lyase [Pseudothermotoga sp.]